MLYLTIEELIEKIDEPNRGKVKTLHSENIELFKKAKGSKTKHQAWEGGYIDHLTEVMNLANVFYESLKSFNRVITFSLSDALLILYLHDLEKPWKQLGLAEMENSEGTKNQEKIKSFRDSLILKYGIELTLEQKNALNFVEGEIKEYSPTERLMGELAAFCHVCDIISARLWWDYPKK